MRYVTSFLLLVFALGNAQIIEWIARYNEFDDQPESP